ncbi:MAG TPA: FAD-dependent oxidoreductase [Verrucomicrobiae bacterium]|nr:FAD-dependent oxidoreductase [Verrucomicrobiae bacterium]
MSVEQYQNVVIGSGEAGKYLAWTLAKMGQRTVVVERSRIGGSCPNVACLPSKNVIHSAKVASLVSRAGEFGIRTGPANVDMAGVFERKRRMVDGLIELNLGNYKASGAELVMGDARFVEPKTVGVTLSDGGARTLRGERVFLNVGTRADVPDMPGLKEAKPMTHIEALNLQRLPEHLVILGGGYVGVEFAQMMRRLGSRVTVVHRGSQLLSREDPDVAEALRQLLLDEGVEILLNARTLGVKGCSGERVHVRVTDGNATGTIDASDILAATGRVPNADGIDPTKGGVELDARGYIRVNEKLQTTAADVWAMGECAGSPQFTHVSFDDYRVVRDNLMGKTRTTRDRLIPYCLFTDPELAHVGMTETEARTKGVEYRLAKMPMAAVLRTRTLSETRGFVKALVGRDDRLVGFTAFGVEASEMMAVAQTAMLGKIPYSALGDAIFTHPTMAEGFTGLFSHLS